jgi:hypothetical protein
MVRKALQIASIVMTEAPCPQGYYLELEWTPKGAIAAARLAFPNFEGISSPGPVAYEMNRSDAEIVARVASTYLATPRAMPPESPDVRALIGRFPALFSPSASGNGIVPSPSLLILAEQIRRHGALGRLPLLVTTPACKISFKGDLIPGNGVEVQPA